MQTSIPRGQSAEWLVGVWTTGANVSAATVSLSAAPSSQKATFSVGCSHDGTASCSLGAVDANSAVRQLQARVSVPATATSVTSVRLTAVARAASAVTDPRAAATISVTAAGTAAVAAPITPLAGSSDPLSVGNLPFLNGTASTLSPGGNAAGLFPALNPSGDPAANGAGREVDKPLAATSALPEDQSVIGAQVAGLVALALAIVLAVTRLSIRRRPVPKPPLAK